MRTYKKITDLIGNTPLLELENYGRLKNLGATIFGKLEYFNPAGSVKDRIAKAMIDGAEAKDGLHIAENHILVETVDIHTGEILEPGQVGELVFTTLRKHARPLIRFRTGDIGWIDNTKCSCGRTHGRIHIQGRKDDMFIVSTVNVSPATSRQWFVSRRVLQANT